MSVTSGVTTANTGEGEAFVCLAPDCEEVFTRGKGGRRTDAKYCSERCRQAAHRSGQRLSPIDKAGELSIKAARLQRTIEETMQEVRSMGERQDRITNAYSVANAAHVSLWMRSVQQERERQQEADMETIQ